MRAGTRKAEVVEEEAEVEEAEAAREPRWFEGPMTDYQIGLMNGAIVGLAVGLGAAAVVAWRRRRREEGEEEPAIQNS